MIQKLWKISGCPFAVLSFVMLVSALSLVAAYIAEYVFLLEPCILCLYQRIPFAAAVIFGGAAFLLKQSRAGVSAMLWLSGLALFINAGLAFYHTGVEQHWWVSALEGCAVSFDTSASESLLSTILAAPTARCDEIPWSDPILGLSMANYNIVLSLGLGGLCALCALRFKINPADSASA